MKGYAKPQKKSSSIKVQPKKQPNLSGVKTSIQPEQAQRPEKGMNLLLEIPGIFANDAPPPQSPNSPLIQPLSVNNNSSVSLPQSPQYQDLRENFRKHALAQDQQTVRGQLQRSPLQTSGVAQRKVIQRDQAREPGTQEDKPSGGFKAEAEVHTPGTKFAYDYQFKEVGNHSGHLKVAFESKGSTLVEGKAGYEGADKDKNDTPDREAGGEFKILENEAVLKRSGGKFTKELASSLGAVEVGASPFEWLKVKVEGKFLEGTFDWEKAETELDVAKVAVGIEGTLPEDVAKKFLPKPIAEFYEIKVIGEYEYSIPFADLAKLKKMHKASQEMIEHGEQLAKKQKELDKLAKRRAEVKKALDQGGDFHQYGKKTKKKLAKKGIHSRKDFEAHKKALKAELRDLNKQVDKLDDGIKKHRKILKKAQQKYTKAASGLKSKAGKLMAKALGKAGAKVLAKVCAYLVPGLNVASLALDIIEVGNSIYDLATGKAKFGLGGGEEGGGKEGEEGSEGGGKEGKESSSSGSGEGGTSGSGGSGSGQKDTGVPGGTKETGITEAKNKEGDGGTSTSPGLDSDLYGEVEDPYANLPKLHSNAEKVLEALRAKPGQGVELSPEDLSVINDVIDQDLTPEQLAELITRLKAEGGEAVTDVDELIGRVMRTVQNVKTGQKQGDRSATINGEEDITDIMYGDGSQSEVQATEKPEINTEQVTSYNNIEQKVIGWTVEEITGGKNWDVNSPEFAEWVANYQQEKGLLVDGIVGPVTTSARYEELGLTESPIYQKAQKELNRRKKRVESKQNKAEEKGGIEGGEKGDFTGDKSTEEENLGGVKETKKEEKETPKELLPEFPPCIGRDETTGKYYRDEKKIQEYLHNTYTHPDGLKVVMTDIDVDISDTQDKNPIQLIYIAIKVEVIELPGGAAPDYPFQIGQEDVARFSFSYDPQTDQYRGIAESGMDNIIRNYLAVASDGTLVVAPSVKGKPIDLEDIEGKIMRVVSQTSKPSEKGGTSYDVVVEVIPTKLKGSEFLIIDGKRHFYKVGQPMMIPIDAHLSAENGG